MIGGMSSVVVHFPSREAEQGAAACAQHPSSWWFEPARWPKAIEICRGCPMRSDCLGQALQQGERLGVWGGLTPEQRAALPNATVIPIRRPRGAPR
jgi:WhiB family redox-sensing transcriptional regulator